MTTPAPIVRSALLLTFALACWVAPSSVQAEQALSHSDAVTICVEAIEQEADRHQCVPCIRTPQLSKAPFCQKFLHLKEAAVPSRPKASQSGPIPSDQEIQAHRKSCEDRGMSKCDCSVSEFRQLRGNGTDLMAASPQAEANCYSAERLRAFIYPRCVSAYWRRMPDPDTYCDCLAGRTTQRPPEDLAYWQRNRLVQGQRDDQRSCQLRESLNSMRTWQQQFTDDEWVRMIQQRRQRYSVDSDDPRMDISRHLELQ